MTSAPQSIEHSGVIKLVHLRVQVPPASGSLSCQTSQVPSSTMSLHHASNKTPLKEIDVNLHLLKPLLCLLLDHE